MTRAEAEPRVAPVPVASRRRRAAEGDDFHTQASVDKMAAGYPLSDHDRIAWPESLTAWTRERHDVGESTLLVCSTLKRSYRDLLRRGGRATFLRPPPRRQGHAARADPDAIVDQVVAEVAPLA